MLNTAASRDGLELYNYPFLDNPSQLSNPSTCLSHVRPQKLVNNSQMLIIPTLRFGQKIP